MINDSFLSFIIRPIKFIFQICQFDQYNTKLCLFLYKYLLETTETFLVIFNILEITNYSFFLIAFLNMKTTKNN